MRPESERIDFVVRRDGVRAARTWVERTLGIYRQAVKNPTGFASNKEYKPQFDRAIREMEEWLAIKSRRQDSRQ